MKIRILFLFALVLTLSLAVAPSANARQNAKAFEEFKQTLGLTNKQKSDWKALDRSIKIKITQVKKSDLAEAEKKEKIKDLQRAKQIRLKQILTKEQWNKLIAYRKEHRSKDGN